MMIRQLVSTGKHRGALAFELAMIAPAFFVVALGIVEIGRGVMVSNIVANAAQEGAETAIANGSTNVEVISAVQTYLNSALALSAADVSIEIAIFPALGNRNPANDVANCQKGDQISVLVRVPSSRVSLMSVRYFTRKTVVGQSSMTHE